MTLHCLWIECTAWHVFAFWHSCTTCNTFIVRHWETPIVTTYAWLYIFNSVFHKFGYPFAVNQKLSCNTHCINVAIQNGFCSSVRFHSSCTNNWNINIFFKFFNIIKVAVKWHICRWVSPIPSIISSVVCIKHIIARILKIFCGFNALFHISANFFKFFARNCTFTKPFGFACNRITKRNREVASTSLFYCLNNVSCKAIAVFKTATIFISSLICVLGCELVKKITFMNCMNFNTINTRFFKFNRSFCKGINHFFNFFNRKWSGFNIFSPPWRKFTWGSHDVFNINNWFNKSL